MNHTIDGAWGLRLPDMQAATHVLVEAPQWPAIDLDVRHLTAANTDETSFWDGTGMGVPLAAGGHLSIRWPRAVTLSLLGRPIAECVIQPHLTTAAAAIAMRGGMQPFHAGAFELEGRAWVVLGARQAGKSSTLALASLQGSLVVTDDLLVIDDGSALAGPRCVDLRVEAARALDIGTNLGTVGLRERWRVYMEACPVTMPVAGFVVPSWGSDEVGSLPPISRLETLFSNSALQGITMNVPDEYLRLASLPMLAWVRPKSWSRAERSFDLLRKTLTHGLSRGGI